MRFRFRINPKPKDYTEKLCRRFAFLPVFRRKRDTGELEIIWLEFYYNLYRYDFARWWYKGSYTKDQVPEKFKNGHIWEAPLGEKY